MACNDCIYIEVSLILNSIKLRLDMYPKVSMNMSIKAVLFDVDETLFDRKLAQKNSL
jgi:uncharacterized protein YfaA (DUF2138 family)